MLAVSQCPKYQGNTEDRETNSKCIARNTLQSSDWKDQWKICKIKKGKKQIPAVEALQTKARGVKDLIKLQSVGNTAWGL